MEIGRKLIERFMLESSNAAKIELQVSTSNMTELRIAVRKCNSGANLAVI
jgi:hypothetical protein